MKRSRLALVALAALVVAGCGGGDTPLTESRGKHPLAAQPAQPSDYTDVVQSLYVSYYGRPADPAGLKFWADYLAQGQAPTILSEFLAAYASNPAVKTVVDNFGRSEESVALYGEDNGKLVDAIYLHLFNRTPDSQGREFYLQGLANQLINKTQAALTILNGAADTDKTLISKKLASASGFTTNLAQSDLTSSYDGLEINEFIRRQLFSITLTSEPSLEVNRLLSALSTRTTSAFSKVPSLLPDLRGKYNQLCGLAVNMQNAIPVDLNSDGRKDLLLPVWCFFKSNQDPSGPVINGLIALVQNIDGTFEDRTVEIFGSDLPSLDGKNQNWTVADFNGDGRPDIILGTDREDGRPVVGDGFNMRSRAVSIMSSPAKYTITPFGIPRFGDNVIILEDGNRLRLLVITADTQVEMWEYKDGWTQIQNEFDQVNKIQKNPVFLKTSGTDGAIENKYLINNVIVDSCDSTGCQKISYKLELWANTAGLWKKLDESQILQPKKIQATTPGQFGTTNYITTYVATFEGEDYLDMGFVYDGCSIKIEPASPEIALRSFLGDKISGGYSGQSDINADWRPPTLKIFPIEVADNKLTVGKSILSDLLPSNYYRMKCKDYNGDGYDDILIELGGGGAVFYFNDKNGGFKKPKNGVVPLYSSQYFSFGALYEDLDGDGYSDLLYYPITGTNLIDWQYADPPLSSIKVQIPIFKAFRNIDYWDFP